MLKRSIDMLVVQSCLFILVAFIVASFAQIPQLDFNASFRFTPNIARTCANETEIDLREVVHASPSSLTDFDSPKHKQFFLCLMKSNNFIGEDGKLNKHVIRENLKENAPSPQIANKLVNTCAVEKETPEDTAFNFITCGAVIIANEDH